MALTYGQILNQAALRLGASGVIAGSQMADVETNYNDPTFDAGNIDSPRFLFSAQKDALRLAEEKIGTAIANIPDHPLRSFLTSFSANVASRATIPNADVSGNKKVGVIGNIYDTTDNTLLTYKDISEVERLLRLKSNAVLAGNYYFYNIHGAKIIHTRTNVKIEFCTYNQTTQKTAINNNSTCLLPDSEEELLVCGEISYLFLGDEAPETVQQYVQYFADGIARLEKQGEMSQ